jgi:RNA polymerase sigma-70 factor (ECF subfamily)
VDDSQIVAEVLQGNVDSFAEVVRRYHRQLYYFVIGKVSDDTEAEDIVQKTFITAYRKLNTFDPSQVLFNWLRGIALGHCRNQWRSYERQARLRQRLVDARRGELEIARLNDTSIESESKTSLLRECLSKLSEHEQETVTLRFVQGLSLKQIGDATKKNAEAVRFFLFRIRLRLRNCVKSKLALQEAK